MSARRGILVIISSPSGAGKTTLARRLLSEFADDMEFSVSYTTRKPRGGEKDGVDYTFVNNATFDAMIEQSEFAEWAHVHGNRYGTARAAVERALVDGRDMVFDVDGQGGRALDAKFPDDALMIFILPPDLQTLATRLRQRATDAPEVIELRLRKAIDELTYHREYDHRIVNDDLEGSYRLLRGIYLARRQGTESPENDDTANVAHAEQLIAAGKA